MKKSNPAAAIPGHILGIAMYIGMAYWLHPGVWSKIFIALTGIMVLFLFRAVYLTKKG